MSQLPQKIVIVGAGHAGVECASALRQKGFAGSIDLLSDEVDLPYQRPPLSKEYIKRPGNPLVLKPAQFFADNAINLRLGARAAGIDRIAHTVRLENGEVLSYDHLVIATGARNRKVPVAGLNHADIVELRSLADANRIVSQISGWKRVAVVGGGFIGLEAAGLLATMGVQVDVIEMAPRLMQRAVSPAISSWFLSFHRTHGVNVHLEVQVTAIEHSPSGKRLFLSDGSAVESDAVILAAGVLPNAELAFLSGLVVENGIVVDENLVTSDPDVSAIGDVANYPSRHLPGMARLESVQNAGDQARTVAARLTGETLAYDALPWFWSIQGEARLQIAGLSRPGLTEVLRGDPAGEKFSVFLFDGERLAAVESVNAAADHMMARRLIGAGTKVDPARASDLSVDLKSLGQA